MLLKNRILFLFILLTLFATRTLAQCVATITSSAAYPCYGTNDTLYATTAAGNAYQWSYSATPGGTYAPLANATARSYITTLGGYYKVSIHNGACNVTSGAYSLTFDVFAAPSITLTGTDTICPGQTVVISANTGYQITYQWAKDGQVLSGFTGTSVMASATGNYSVTETDQNGCSAISPTVGIYQRVAPVPVLSPGNQIAVCDSLSTLIATSPVAGATYAWAKLAGGGFNAIAGATNSSYLATASGSYQVTATYGSGCVQTSSPVTATFSTTPALPVIASNSPICLGNTLSLSVTNGMPGYTYSWHGPNNYSGVGNPVSIAMSSPLDSGNYTLTVANNGCTNTATVHVTVTCLDSVWPGDVNADHVVDNNDALDLALGWGYTGQARNGVSNAFAAQFCADWNNNIIAGVNRKHADCNGDGGIDTNDLAAIYNNYGDIHAKGIHMATAKTTGFPNLYFDLSNTPYLYPGHTVSIPIVLGSITTPMYNVMGIAADIKIAGLSLTAPPTITYPASWLGSAGNTLRFAKLNAGSSSTTSSIGWAYARIDHQNASGQGTLANINFTVPASGVGYNSWAFLYLENVTLIDNGGNIITNYNVLDDTTIANPTAISAVATTVGTFATIAPNPSAAGMQTWLKTDLPAPATLSISVTDVTGRTMWAYTTDAEGKQDFALPQGIVAGIYFIHIQRSTDNFVQTLRWLKN